MLGIRVFEVSIEVPCFLSLRFNPFVRSLHVYLWFGVGLGPRVWGLDL